MDHCTIKQLPDDMLIVAAQDAIRINPANAPPVELLAEAVARSMIALDAGILQPYSLAVLTNKYWGATGVDLTVGFMEPIDDALADRIISHGNAWGQSPLGRKSNVKFRRTKTDPDIRISREGGGYWSYLGTDNRSIPKTQPTMTLSGFTMQSSEAEFKRVVRHEFGHALGFPHEQALPGILALLDFEKCIAVKMRQLATI